MNVPPAANVATTHGGMLPIGPEHVPDKEPDMSAPVVKLTLPKLEPVIDVIEGIPVIAINCDPLNISVGLDPDEAVRVPPTFA